mmetsp:Transcript_3235/g.6546  ORF Transcript_3235/g.6546 Transcript_3235/m.6546 type:complete len:200 (+) Transcript_3235:3-602(+)
MRPGSHGRRVVRLTATSFTPLSSWVWSPWARPFLNLDMSRHKLRWVEEVAASQGPHRAALDAGSASCRQRLQALEEQRCAERVPADPSDVLLPVAVTMATGQEGMAVVRKLATSHSLAGVAVCALVRSPASANACVLAALPPQVEKCVCESTVAAPLCRVLAGMHAVYPCTTLNSAHARSELGNVVGWRGLRRCSAGLA